MPWSEKSAKSHAPWGDVPVGTAHRSGRDVDPNTWGNWITFANGMWDKGSTEHAGTIAYGMLRLGMFDDMLLAAGLDRADVANEMWKLAGGPEK